MRFIYSLTLVITTFFGYVPNDMRPRYFVPSEEVLPVLPTFKSVVLLYDEFPHATAEHRIVVVSAMCDSPYQTAFTNDRLPFVCGTNSKLPSFIVVRNSPLLTYRRLLEK